MRTHTDRGVGFNAPARRLHRNTNHERWTMNQPMVRIEKYGEGMDLYIADISRAQMARLEKASAFWGRLYWRRSLQKIWYTDGPRMQALFGVTSFRQMKSENHRYLGPVLPAKSDLDEFVSGIRFYRDDDPMDIDPSKVRTRFTPTPPLPPLTAANVVVFHGEYYRGTTGYDIELDGPFSIKQLRLNLVECGANGFVLRSVSYQGRQYFGKETAESRGFLKPQFMVR